MRGGVACLPVADGYGDAIAFAQAGRFGGDGVPGDIAEAAEGGEVGRDAIPLGGNGDVFRSADAGEPLGSLRDGSTITDVEFDLAVRGDVARESDDGLAQ